MVIIHIVINTLLGGLTLDPAGMHCPAWDDAFVSSLFFLFLNKIYITIAPYTRNFEGAAWAIGHVYETCISVNNVSRLQSRFPAMRRPGVEPTTTFDPKSNATLRSMGGG